MPYATCTECNRAFNLEDEADAEEWFYGHDCEEIPEIPLTSAHR